MKCVCGIETKVSEGTYSSEKDSTDVYLDHIHICVNPQCRFYEKTVHVDKIKIN